MAVPIHEPTTTRPAEGLAKLSSAGIPAFLLSRPAQFAASSISLNCVAKFSVSLSVFPTITLIGILETLLCSSKIFMNFSLCSGVILLGIVAALTSANSFWASLNWRVDCCHWLEKYCCNFSILAALSAAVVSGGEGRLLAISTNVITAHTKANKDQTIPDRFTARLTKIVGPATKQQSDNEWKIPQA